MEGKSISAFLRLFLPLTILALVLFLAFAQPTIDTLTLNSTYGTNLTNETLTAYVNSSNATTFVFQWKKDGKDLALINLPFDLNNTTTAKDYSSYGNDCAVDPGEVVWTPNGKVGGALIFNATNGIDCGSPSQLDQFSTEVTVEFWFNMPQLENQGIVVAKGNDFYMFMRSDSSYPDGRIQVNWNSEDEFIRIETFNSTDPLPINAWHHVAFTLNDGVAKIFFDGVQRSNSSGHEPVPDHSGSSLEIGSLCDGCSSRYNGSLDEFRLYNFSLTDEQIYQRFLEVSNSLNSSTIVPNETDYGEVWSVNVTPVNSTEAGPSLSASIQVAQTNPPTLRPSINSTDGSNHHKQDLNCYTTIWDRDDSVLNVSVRWYNGTTLKLDYDYNNTYSNNTLFVATLNNTNTSIGDFWKCELRLFDGTDYSDWRNSSSLAVINNLPQNVSARISPDLPFDNETLIGYCNATEPDGDPLNYYYEWYKNDVLNITGYAGGQASGVEVNLANLSAGNTTEDDTWAFFCIPADDVQNATNIFGYGVTIASSTRPQVYSRINATMFNSTEDLRGYCLGTDPNGDNLNYSFAWYFGDIANISGTSNGSFAPDIERNIANLSSGNTSSGDWWSFGCNATDGTQWSREKRYEVYINDNNTYFVDIYFGNNSNDGLHPDRAWENLTNVKTTHLDPGEAILFKRGEEWRGDGHIAPYNAGTPTHRIIYGAYGSGPLPILEYNYGTDGVFWLEVSGTEAFSYATFQDLRFENSVRGIFTDGNDGSTSRHDSITVKDCEFYNVEQGVFIQSGSYHYMKNVTCEYAANGCIAFYGSAYNKTSHVLVEDCHASGTWTGNDGFTVHQDESAQFNNAGENITFARCVANNFGEGGFDITAGWNILLINCSTTGNAESGFQIGHTANNVTILNYVSSGENFGTYNANTTFLINAISDGGGPYRIFQVSAPGQFVFEDRNLTDAGAYHTLLLYGPSTARALFDAHWGGRPYSVDEMIFKNNIFSTSAGGTLSGIDFLDPYRPGNWTNYTFDYNIWYPVNGTAGGNYFGDLVHGHFNFSTFKDAFGKEAHGMEQDPQFVDWANQDYNLSYLSPAIDAGEQLNFTELLPYVTTPEIWRDLYSRPIYGIRDIGPIEYQPPFTIGTDRINLSAGHNSTIRLYGDGKYRYLENITGFTNQSDLSVVPQSGWPSYDIDEYIPQWLDIEILNWNSTYMRWNETNGTSLANTVHTLGGLNSSHYYLIKVNMAGYDNKTSNGLGQLTFTYNGSYSEVNFELQDQGPAGPGGLSVVLNSTYGTNLTNESLTAYVPDLNSTTNVFVWKVNGQSLASMHYPFDVNVSDYSSALVKDYSTNNHNATLGNGVAAAVPIWNATCALGGCYDFDGSNDWIETGVDAADLNISGLASRTACVWVYARNFTGHYGGVFEFGSYVDQGGQLFCLLSDLTTDRWQMQFYNTSAANNFDVPGSLNNWTHICMTYNGTTAVAYANGTYATSVQTTNNVGTSENIRLGRYATYYFNGSIDDFRVYDRALSPEQVNQLYIETRDNYLSNSTIVSNETDYTEVWSLTVYPLNSTFEGTPVSSNSLFIHNTDPPSIYPNINSTDGTNHYTQDLNCYATIYDNDDPNINVSVRWYNSTSLEFDYDYNNTYPNNTNFVATLFASNISIGDIWRCEIRLHDGAAYSDWRASSALTVTNNEPAVSKVRLNPTSPLDNETLVGYCNATDPDGDNVNYFYRWLKNGYVNISGYSSGHASGAEVNLANLSAGNTSEDDTWSLSCLANDDFENSTEWNTTFVTIISSTRPLAQPRVNATRFNSTEDLQGFCQGVDPNGDSVNLTFGWYVNGVLNSSGYKNDTSPSGSEFSLSNLTSSNTSQGDWISFACQVTDGSEYSREQRYYVYINDNNTYFIDSVNGNDGNNGLHPDSAWQGFGNIGTRAFSPGQAILLKRGDVFNIPSSETLFNDQGTGTHKILYSAYGYGRKPIVDGTAASGEYMRVAASNITIENWQVQNMGDVGFTVESSGVWREGLTFDNLEFYHMGSYPLLFGEFQGTRDSVISNCHIEDIDYGAIAILGHDTQHSYNIEIYNNTLIDVDGDAITIHEGHSNYLYYAGTNISIHGNTINDALSDCIDLTTGSEVLVYNNTLANCGSSPVQIGHSHHNSEVFHNKIYAGPGIPLLIRSQDIKFWGNIIYGGTTSALTAIGDEQQYDWDLDHNNTQFYRNTLVLDGETTALNMYDDPLNVGEYLGEIYLYDNVFTTATGSIPSGILYFYDIDEFGPANGNFTADGNLYGPGAANFTNVSNFNDWRTIWGHDLNGLNTDPLLSNASTGDVRLHYLSPAIDAGTGQFHRSNDTDFYNNPVYGTPDIGAVEYQPPYILGANPINASASIRIYADGKFRYTSNISAETYSASFSVAPSGGWSSYNATATRPEWMDLQIHDWNSSYANWTESNSTPLANTVHTLGGLNASHYYLIKVNTAGYDNKTSNGLGQLTFTYNGSYSEVNFEVQDQGPAGQSIVLNSTYGTNLTNESLTAYVSSNNYTTNLFLWKVNGKDLAVLYYPFDINVSDYSAALVKDYSSYGNNATLGEGISGRVPNWTSNGAVGGAYSFDGVDDSIESGVYASELGLSGTGPKTICAWAYAKAFSGTGGIFEIGSYDDEAGQLLCLQTTTTDNQWRMQLYNSTANQYFTVPNSLNNWEHFCLVYNGTHKIVYANGTLAASVNNVAGTGDSLTLRIGRYATNYFNGSIDDIRIYNRSLSPEQINQLYLETKGNYLFNSTIVANETYYADIWSVTLYPLNSTFEGTPVSSGNLTIQNSNPPTFAPSINSTDGSNHHKQDLNCYATIWDQDADSLNVSVRWYLNNDLNRTDYYNNTYPNNTAFVATLLSSNTSIGDTWSCELRLYDGTGYSDWMTSGSIAIINNLPVPISARISPSEPLDNETLVGYCNSTESDSDPLGYYWSWLKNDVVNITGYAGGQTSGVEANIANLSAGNTSEDDVWTFSCLSADDFQNATAWVDDSETIFSSTRPRVTPRINATLFNTANNLWGYCLGSDPNGNNLNYSFSWYRNGVANLSGTNNGDLAQGVERSLSNLTSGNLSQGDQWSFGCNATDGTEWSREQRYEVYINNYNTYFIDATNGNDANNGLHPDRAWKNLTKLNFQTFGPSDYVLFRRGQTFTPPTNDFIIYGAGNSSNRVIWAAYGTGAKPIIDGTPSTNEFFDIRTDYLTMRDLRFQNIETGLFNTKPTWIIGQIYDNLEFYNSGREGILFGVGVHDLIIRNNLFQHIGYRDASGAITILGNTNLHSYDIDIYNNTLIDVNGDMLTVHEGNSNYLQYAGTNISIHDNYFWGSPISDCVDLTTGSFIKLYNNTIGNCTQFAITTGHSVHDVEIFHNNIYTSNHHEITLFSPNVSFWGNIIHGNSSAPSNVLINNGKQFVWDLNQTNGTFYRNTFVWNGQTNNFRISEDSAYLGSPYYGPLGTVYLYDNMFTTAQSRMPNYAIDFQFSNYQADDARFSANGNLYGPGSVNFYENNGGSVNLSWSNWQAYGHDLNGSNTDPMIVNVTEGNFDLNYLSPAIDAGTGQYYRSEDTDFYNKPIYGTPDVGAIEYQPPYMLGTNPINASASIRIYADGKFRYTVNISNQTASANLSIVPSGGWPSYNSTAARPAWMDIEVLNWTTSHKSWNETNRTSLTNTNHTVGDCAPSANYLIKVDGVGYDVRTANSSGYLNFTYNGTYSEHTFEMQEQGGANYPPDTPSVGINSTTGSNDTNDDLNCFATITDPEGDNLNASVRWYKNGVLDLSYDYNATYPNGTAFVVTLDDGNTSIGEVWHCSIRLFDNTSYSSWSNSTILTIADSESPNYTTYGQNVSTIDSINSSILLYSNWTDNGILNYYIFSYNLSTAWVNDTPVAFATSWANITKTISVPNQEGRQIAWRTYANDTAGNRNATPPTYFQITSDPPRWSQQGQNASAVYTGQSVLAFAFWSDNFQLNQTWLEHNLTGVFQNVSYTLVANLTRNATFILTPSSAGNYSWRVWANDSIGNLNTTDYLVFAATTPPDLTSPNYLAYGQNTSTISSINSSILFYSNWTDNIALSRYIFSWNLSTSWTNDSSVAFSNSWANITKTVTIPADEGKQVAWRTYANDTSTNWNATPVSYIQLSSQPPLWSLKGQNSSSVYTGDFILAWSFWSDNFEVNRTWLEHNLTGSFTNYSLTSVSNKTYNSTFSIDTAGRVGNFSWRIWSNDSVGNANTTSYTPFTVNTPPDLASPNYTTYGQNVSTIDSINSSILLYSNWTDNIALSRYIFSWNLSTSWTNDSSVAFSNSWANITKTISVPNQEGRQVAWRTYANDTSNNWNATPLTYFQLTSDPPRWSATGQNASTLQSGESLRVWSFWSDNFALNYTWLEHNLTGSFANYTRTAVANKTYNSTFVIDTTNRTGSFVWRIWSNDSVGNINSTSLSAFAVIDTVGPYWNSQSQNNSAPGRLEAVRLSARISDNYRLSSAILSTNETGGVWQNKSVLSMTQDNSVQWANFTWSNASISPGTTVGWTIYLNDTQGNWNQTAILSFTIVNLPPVIVSSRISPLAPLDNETLSGFCNSTDPEAQAVSYYWRWYKNGALNLSGLSTSRASGVEASVNNLTADNTAAGENWTLSCLSNDGLINSTSWANSSVLVLSIELPTTLSSRIEPTSPSAADDIKLFCNGTTPDQSNLTYHYRVYNSTVLFTSGNSSGNPFGHEANVYNLSNSSTSLGDTWVFSCLAGNGTVNATNWINASSTIQNGAPTPVPRISPSTAYASSDLTGYCKGTDPEGQAVSYYYRWYVGTSLFSSGAASGYVSGFEILLSTVTSSNLSLGQTWTFSCLATDGSSNSTWTNSSVTISSAPTLPPSGPGSGSGSPSGGSLAPPANKTVQKNETARQWPLTLTVGKLSITRNYTLTSSSSTIVETFRPGGELKRLVYNVTMPSGFGAKLSDLQIIGPTYSLDEGRRIISFTIPLASAGVIVPISYRLAQNMSESTIRQLLVGMVAPTVDYALPSAEPVPVCGNSVVEAGEQCDGSAPANFTCTSDCRLDFVGQKQEIAVAGPDQTLIVVAVLILLGGIAGYFILGGNARQAPATQQKAAVWPKPTEVFTPALPVPQVAEIQQPPAPPAAVAPQQTVEFTVGRIREVAVGNKPYKLKLLELHDEDVLIFVLTTMSSIHLKPGEPQMVDFDEDGKAETEVLGEKTASGGLKLSLRNST